MFSEYNYYGFLFYVIYMTTIEKQLETFKSLDFDKRQSIVFDILKELKETNDNFKYIYENLLILKPNEWLINDLYEDLAKLAEEKREAIKNIEKSKINTIIDYIKRIQEAETEDRNKEDPEVLLKIL